MTTPIKKRGTAALIHFGFSALIVSSVLAAIYFLWYPFNLAFATDAIKILAIICIVDITLGPVLTFLIYNEQKKELKRDILIVLLIQISALIYGIYTIAIARPAYVTFSVDRFEISYAQDITNDELLDVSDPHFKKQPSLLSRPEWISAHLPTDIDEKNDLTLNSAEGGEDIHQIPKYFKNIEASKDEIMRRAKPVELLSGDSTKADESIKDFIDKPNYGFFPLAGKSRDFSVIINKDTLTIEAVVDIDPWR